MPPANQRKNIRGWPSFLKLPAASSLAFQQSRTARICSISPIEKTGSLPDVLRPETMPGGKPFQSKLTPFYEQIARLRKKHTPYPEIAKRLHDEHGLKVSPSTIFEFVKVRARRSGVFALPEVPIATPLPAPSSAATHEAPGVPPAQAKKARMVDGGELTPAAPPRTPAAAAKKYVFTPKPKPQSRFSDEDLEFNDPLK